jgi:hypothetical protein
VTGAVAVVAGADGCPAVGEAVCCPVAALAVGSCGLPVPAAPVATVFWTVPEAELVEAVPAEIVVAANWPAPGPEEPALASVAAGADWPVLDWPVLEFELPVPDRLVPEAWESVLPPVGLVAEAEGAVPERLAAAPAEALPDCVLFVEGWLPPEAVAPELVLLELVPADAEPEFPARAGGAVLDAVLTAEPATELAVETGESAEEGAEPGGGGGSVAACACRENTSMIRKIPAATIASCTARRATRRAIGCGMSFSHRRVPDLTRLPVFRGPMPRAEVFLSPKPDVAFGHHRTTISPGDARGGRDQCAG